MHPTPRPQVEQLEAVDAAERALGEARTAEQGVRKALRLAEGRAKELKDREDAARTTFDRERDRLSGVASAITTPLPERRGDLAADWDADRRMGSGRDGRPGPAGRRSRRRGWRRSPNSAPSVCGSWPIAAPAVMSRSTWMRSPPADLPRDLVVDRLARSEAERTRLDGAMAEAETVGGEVERARTDGEVATELGRHLAASGFERWLLDEALLVLVEGATEVLHTLSGGQYSFALDPKTRNFTVVDHRNADQPRSARTLSGGETFLASLALALALADQITLLAARGGARLESIILDEGFGALDPATLDVVASAIEELGAQGRMVGLISHVAELAERVPVRYVVDKIGTSSSVERVDR